MKKLIALAIVLGLVGGYMGATAAQAKKKKPKLVAKAAKLYLRDDNGCDDPNYLSKTDGPDTGCWQSDSFLNEPIINQAHLIDEGLIAQHFEARDGVPFQLDATKALTGEVTSVSGQCIDSSVPCSPVGVGAGQASIDVTVRGMVNGTDTVLGRQSDTFAIAPSQSHTMNLNLTLDKALNKKQLSSLTVDFYPHGVALFHSGVSLDDPASFITVPTLVKKK